MSINVILGMSGGVDSSIAAYILKKRGYNVIGIFMLNWDEKNISYCSVSNDIIDTKKICDFLNIKFYIVNFCFDYWYKVFIYFLNEYKLGKTPNPDIICNNKIKFSIFLEYSKYLGCDFIATGHYSKIKFSNSNHIMCQPFDLYKDQTYFLYKLTQYHLKYIIFPLYKYSKFFIRTIAFNIGLFNSMKKDSNGICFIGNLDFKFFLKKYISICYGPVVNAFNKQVDIHEGIMFYTYGQKKNILNYYFSFSVQYIFNKNLYNNLLEVACKNMKSFKKFYCIVKNVDFINFFFFNLKCFVKIRHGFFKEKCLLIRFTNNFFIVKFFIFQQYVAPGQFVVFYKNDVCLGGGIIISIECK